MTSLESRVSPSNQPRLAKEVRDAARKTLKHALSMWLAEPAADLKRVVRRAGGPGSFSINIEPYRGSRTWIAFDKKLSSKEEILRDLEVAIKTHQPELLGYLALPGRTQFIRDARALLTTWCQTATTYVPSLASEEAAIERVLSELETVLATRRLQQTVTTALAGLQLPPDTQAASLPNGLVLRLLSDDELTDLASHDVTFGHHQDIISHSVNSCFVATEDVAFALEHNAPQATLMPTFEQKVSEHVSSALSAMHLTKEGRVGVFVNIYSLRPAVFPHLGGHSSGPLVRSPFSSMGLTEAELNDFLVIHQRLLQNTRDELQISANRLSDAENRLSPVDALLDAAIGLEVLLNPMDSTELSFRVALNYACIGPSEERRARFDRLRSVQKVRNRVVHGGLNLQSPDAPTIHENAQLAKACLRDSLKSFLFDPSLAGNRRLDAEFWLDRMLPPKGLLAKLT